MVKQLITLSIFGLLTITSAHADCIGVVIMGECEGMGTSTSTQNGYKGNSGAQYQYDLSNPIDRNRYSIDTSAQLRDSISRPDTFRDRSRGQFGGGYWGN